MISEFFADGMIPWSPILLSLKVAALRPPPRFAPGSPPRGFWPAAVRLFPLSWTPCARFR